MGGDAVLLIFLVVVVAGLLFAANRALSRSAQHGSGDETRGPR
jgi:hypothetical protein